MAGTGGKRDGAGRPAGALGKAKLEIATRVFKNVDEVAIWTRLLQSENDKVVADVMKYLTDRRDGKPKQPVVGDTDQPIQLECRIIHVGGKE